MGALKSVLGRLRSDLDLASALQGVGFEIGKDAISDASTAKQAGKRIVGCHYVASEFGSKTPKGPAEARELAQSIF